MLGKLRTAWALARSLGDALLPRGRLHRAALRQPAPPRGQPGAERRRAARAVVRLACALGARWRCDRAASLLFVASARGGEPARLVYGVRRSREREQPAGGFVGHAWVESAGATDARLREEYPLVLAFPGGAERSEWRRG